MSGKIKALSYADVVGIAAGEVVTQPAAVVKELIENSIDAGAQKIEVHTVSGGRELIRVEDDGEGMVLEDLLCCTALHTTSKISTLSDLESNLFYGFRGEALASIASTSHLELVSLSQKETSQIAHRLCFSGGVLQSQDKIARDVGTTVLVKDLFFNRPARKKFCKAVATQDSATLRVVQQGAFANYKISFKYFRDGQLYLSLPIAKDLRERVVQVFDQYAADNMLDLMGEKDGISLTGLVGNLRMNFYNHSRAFIFINGRKVTDRRITAAMISAYGPAIERGKYPYAMLFFELDPSQVNVNIHPSKDMVAFRNHGCVTRLCRDTLQRALHDQVSVSASNSDSVFVREQGQEECLKPVFQAEIQVQTNIENKFEGFKEQSGILNDLSVPFDVGVSAWQSEKVVKFPLPEKERGLGYSLLGQLFLTYILIQKEDKFILFDQHAASERIIYEKYKAGFELRDKVKLLFPETFSMEKDDLSALLDFKQEFEQFGFEFDRFDVDQLVLTCTPPRVDAHKAIDVIFSCMNEIGKAKKLDRDAVRKSMCEHIHAQAACKAAVKAGDFLTEVEMQKMISDLEMVENRFQCIHGRPTMVNFEKKDLARWFKRT
jgi:DNA mismatch repair protein MutL